MAKFIDVPEDSKDVNEEEEYANLDEEEEAQIQDDVEDSQEQPDTSDDIPDKYKGKSMSDIVQMHQEAEKLLGRHSSEVGELRKIVDDFIRTNLNKEESPKESEQEEEDFWADPKASIDKLVSNHPSVKKAEETSKQLTQQEVMNRLNTNYPDWEKTVNDEAFTDWVRKSNSRMQKYADANNNLDWDAADDLLGTWADLQKARENAKTTADADVKASRKAASTGNAKASDSAPSRKVYRRSDIINLMKNDKRRYNQLADEIQKAYAEGRVR